MKMTSWLPSSHVIVSTLFLIILLSLSPAWTLYCTQCQASHPGCRYGNYFANACPRNTTHCYTLQLFVQPNGYGTVRGCVIRDNANDECQRMDVNGLQVTGCISVCDWDGCNSAIRSPHPWQTRN